MKPPPLSSTTSVKAPIRRAGIENGAPVAVVAGKILVAVPVGPDFLGGRVLRPAVDLDETDAALGQCVNMGRDQIVGAVASGVERALIVGVDDHDIGLVDVAGRLRCLAETRDHSRNG